MKTLDRHLLEKLGALAPKKRAQLFDFLGAATLSDAQARDITESLVASLALKEHFSRKKGD